METASTACNSPNIGSFGSRHASRFKCGPVTPHFCAAFFWVGQQALQMWSAGRRRDRRFPLILISSQDPKPDSPDRRQRPCSLTAVPLNATGDFSIVEPEKRSEAIEI